MNANKLADTIEIDGRIVLRGGLEHDLIVAALRQYAALEWLMEQGVHPYVQHFPDGYRAFSGRDLKEALGPTVTEAINNLRKLLEPKHEHVWDDTSWNRVVSSTNELKYFERLCPGCLESQKVQRLVPAP